MAGVFRRYSRVPWLRRRGVLPGLPIPTAAPSGAAAAGASSTAVARKVAQLTGAGAAGAATAGVARKVVALGGTCSAGVSSTAAGRKTAPAAGAGSAGAAGSGLPRKVATPLGAGSAGGSGTTQVRKTAAPSGAASAGAATKATSQSGAVTSAGAGTYMAAAILKRVALGGSCVGIAGGRVTSVKKVSLGGAGAAAAAGAGVARKTTGQVGRCAAGVDPAGTARRITTQAGVAAAAGSSTGDLRKTAKTSGVTAAGAAGVAAARRITAAAGTVSAGAVGAAAAVKRAPGGGVGAAGAAGGVVDRKVAPTRGVASAGASPMARTSAAFAGPSSAGPSSTSTARKVAIITGRCTAGVTGRGAAARKVGLAGRCTAGPGGAGQAVKRVPQTGLSSAGASTYGFIIIVGPTSGTRVSPAVAIKDGPIAGTRIVWTFQLDGGALLMETSIDGGATWQIATNGAAIPRLSQGDVRSARTVLTRVTMTRPTAESPSPRLFRIEVEVAIDDSIEETIPLGVFTLNDTEIDDGPRGLTIELAGADLSRKISRNRWDDTYIVEAGVNYATAIQDMLRNRLPDTLFNFASTGRVTPRLFFGEQSSNDPWQDAQDMAAAIGYELFFDARGICTLRPEPDPEVGDSVWEFSDTARPTMIDLRRRVTDENTYNKVVVTGEGSGNTVPVRAVALDDDPASPTYYLGPYGTVTTRFTSSLVLTTEQAQDAANALLRRVKGATEAVELSVIPMPALEPGDVVTVTRDRSKIEGRFLIDQLRIPLGATEPMRAVGRRQRQ